MDQKLLLLSQDLFLIQKYIAKSLRDAQIFPHISFYLAFLTYSLNRDLYVLAVYFVSFKKVHWVTLALIKLLQA